VNPAPVTVRVIFSYLVVFDALAGFLVALALFAVTAALGAPGAAYWAVLVGGTLVFWVPLWLRTRVQFTADELIVVLLLRAHRIPWPSVRSVTFSTAGALVSGWSPCPCCSPPPAIGPGAAAAAAPSGSARRSAASSPPAATRCPSSRPPPGRPFLRDWA
jgi:hypothetical protein